MQIRIGVPRSLIYYYYYPGIAKFFRELGLEVILSPATNREILENGVQRAVEDLCLPFKSYFGHVEELINRVDYIFTPRLISLGPGNCVCPKFMGLPDMLRAVFSSNELPPLIAPDIDLRKGIFPLRRIAHEIGDYLNLNYFKIERALWKGLWRQKKFKKLRNDGYTIEESLAILRGNNVKGGKDDSGLRLAVLGHSYLINDSYLSMDLLGILKKSGAEVITGEMIADKILEQEARRQPKKLFWYFNRRLMGAAYYFFHNMNQKIAGVIQVDSFGCGPDSMVKELVRLKSKKINDISLLNINLDEHSGRAGLKTRLEAFIDLLKRKKMV